MGRNSTNKDDCCQNIDVTTIYTDFIGNPNGPFQIFDDVLPSVDNTYNIGSNALRWKNGYFSTNIFCPLITGPTADLTLNAATGFNIVSSKSLIPDQDNLHFCGFGNKRWQAAHAVTVFADVLSSETGTDLTLTPATGQTIRNTTTILPTADITTDLGSGSFRYANVYGQTINSTTINNTTFNTTTVNATTGNIVTVNATTVNATASQNLSLTASSGFVITANQNIEPSTDSTKNLGSSSKKWQNTFSNSVTATTVSTSGVVTNSVAANPTVDLTLSADSGKSVVTNNPILPNADNTLALGTAVKQWSDVRATQSTIANMNATSLTMNNTITTPTGIDLNLTAATGRNIVASQTLRPAQDITQNCGSTTERWLNVHGQTVTSTTLASPTGSNINLNPATGQIVAFLKSCRPDTDITRNMGSSTVRWLTLFTQSLSTDSIVSPTATDITLNPATGQSVVATKSVLPNADNTVPLGDSTKRWTYIHAVTTYTNTISSINPSNLRLSPPVGKRIELDGPVIPVTASLDFGGSITTWLNVWTETLNTKQITGLASNDVTIDPPTGFDVVSTKTIRPSATATHSLGTSVKTWLNGFIDNLTSLSVTVSDFFKSPADKQGTSFLTTSATLSQTSFTTAPISINASTEFGGLSNSFKFPVKGVYCIDFTSVGDTSTLSGNTITYRLKNTNGGGLTIEQYHRVGDNQTFPPPYVRFSFLFRCDDAVNDRIVIEYKRSNADVTNWYLAEGYCYRVNTFS